MKSSPKIRRLEAVFIALVILLLPSPSYAYIDPGFGALLWQALLAAALGAAYYLYRTVDGVRHLVRRIGRKLIGRGSPKER
jgi:hypothetical protein